MTRVHERINGGTLGPRIHPSSPESIEITAPAGADVALAGDFAAAGAFAPVGSFAVAGNDTAILADGRRAIVNTPQAPVAGRVAR